MKIAFVDFADITYSPLTPEVAPLGGMQSGISYLSRSLAKLGHKIYLFNNGFSEGEYDRVHCFNVDKIPQWHATKNFDVVVSIYCDGERLRSYFGNTPLILFTGHNPDARQIQQLRHPKEQSYWEKIVFKTNWQAMAFINAFGINENKIQIISNAAAPFFTAMEPRKTFFFQENRSPTIYYSSAPFRGLDVLMHAFPIIKNYLPGVKAKIFSSMAVHQRHEQDAQYSHLYEACKNSGMEYIGSLNQKDLACEIAKADILAYPSTFAETSCITMMEAMLNSSVIVAHDLGALKETSGGFGHFISYNSRNNPDAIIKNFASGLISTVLTYHKFPDIGRERLANQNKYARKNYDWNNKALEWADFLSRCVSKHIQNEALPYFSYTITGRKIFLDPKDRRAIKLIISGGNFNPITMHMWKKLIAMHDWNAIIDVGANYGEMLANCELSEHTKVVAIEPNPLIHPFLKKTLRFLDNIHFFDYAVSNISGYAHFEINRGWSGMSKLSNVAEHSIQVKTVSLTDFIQQEFTIEPPLIALLLKIDIEGGEIGALRGIGQILGQFAHFAALVEISHLSDEALQWIFERFFMIGFDPGAWRFTAISNLEQLERFKKTGWKEDAILFRRNGIINDSLTLLNQP